MDLQYKQQMAKEQPERYKAYLERKRQTSQRDPKRIAHNKEQKRQYYLKNRYRSLKSYREVNQAVTEEVYISLLRQQGGVCAICGNPETAKDQKGQVRALAIDHDHSTGRLRGLLCFRCNTNLAFIEDKEYMAASLAYLSKYDPSIETVG